MKKIITTLVLLCSMVTLAQISIGNVEEKKPVPQQEYKPPVYDSLSDFQIQANPNNYQQYVGYKFYLPPKADPKAKDPIVYPTPFKRATSNTADNYDTYYVLLSVLSKNSAFYLIMKNQKSGDTLYWQLPRSDYELSHIISFILEPYFVKQKSLYEKKTFYDVEGGKYTCKEVTLLKRSQVDLYDEYGDRYIMCYVFISNKNGYETRYFQNPVYPDVRVPKGDYHEKVFITEKEFIRQEQESKTKDQALKSKNAAAIAQQKEKEKALYQEWVKKYGKENADLIAAGKVRVGFTQEMCIYAWGPLFKSSTVVNDQGTLITYRYSITQALYFVNGILKQIEQ